jgi:phage terminase large subunit-like protein
VSKSVRARPPGKTSSKGLKNSTVDYVSVAIAFAEDAIDDKRGKVHGPWIRLAGKRFISDLKHTLKKKPRFAFSADQANRACRFVELLPHVEGTWESTTIRLEPFQIFFIVQLFGFRNLSGGRRFTMALLAIARKNAKSTLAAAILLYVLCTEPEQGPQVISAATTGDQARIVWSVAKRMVERTSDLREAFDIEAFANTIVRYINSGTFRPINAKASTQDGLNPSAICLDEIHAHRTHDLVNVLTSAAGARDNVLFLYCTTEGYETPGPWPELRAFAMQVLNGVLEADHYLPVYFTLDDKDDDFDEAAWVKANPLMAASEKLKTAIQKEAIDAKAMAGKLSEFKIKRLNRPSAAATAWVNLHKWRRNSGPVPLASLVGKPCWGGLDLASTGDLTAFALLWLWEGYWYTRVRYWVPDAAVRARTERRTAPYAGWVSAGLVVETSGDVADYDVIRAGIMDDYQRFAPERIAYDPWNATQIANQLTESGVRLEAFRQGAKSYHPAMQAFEIAYHQGLLRHGDNPVLTWNAANLVPRYDENMNMAPDRKRSADKIDGMVALLMAFGIAIANQNTGSADGFLASPVIGR